MTTPVKKNADGTRTFDSQFAAEESSVRARKAAPVRTATPAPESVGARAARIEQKIHQAQYMLTRQSPTDHRLRLLCSAILRRDDVLLDAILSGKSGRR